MDAPRPADNFKSDYKQQVLAAVDIVDLIGRTVALKKRGKDYVGLCPFHQEKSPSFTVSPGKQFFHCYGCKAGGNAIDFVMKRDRLEFLEAMRLLGDAAGIERPNTSPGARQAASQRQQLLDACSTAAGLFQKMLAHPTAGAAGRAYLAERGFSDEIIQRFQIGLTVDAWDRLLRAEAMRAFPPPVMAAAGLAVPRENGNGYYDKFRNRVMFPIRDENGRVIAFGGRVLPGSTDKAKYMNSPETPLFSKSRTVYGLDLARQKVVETRTVAVVEGYADVVMAHQYGATNVVSVLGTALTEQHVAILRRFADRIVLLFDADAAGDTAVDRAVELFLTQPVEIAIASLPDGMDPDEFLLAHGLEAFNALLKGAGDPLAIKERQLARQLGSAGQSLTDRQRMAEAFVDLLAKAKGSESVNQLRWQMGFVSIARQIGMRESDLQALMAARAAKGRAQPFQVPPGHRSESGPAATGQPVTGQPRWQPRKPPNPFRDGPNGGYRSNGGGSFKKLAGDGRAGGPIGTGRRPFPARDEWYVPTHDPRSAAERAADLAAVQMHRDRAERWILAVLLAEPQRWAGLVGKVDVADFTDPGRRKLAEVYWQQQQDEGEPVFNEFLDVLRAASGGDGGVDLASLAVDLLAELEGRTGDADAGVRPQDLLTEAVRLLDEIRAADERAKLAAQLRRTSGAAELTGPVAAPTSADVLRQLQERARRPDMRRLGS